jgi:hypothetical protein
MSDGIHEQVSSGEQEPRGRGCLWTGSVATLLCVPGAVAGVRVIQTAEEAQEVDVLPGGAATFLVWLSLPTAFFAARRLRRRWAHAPVAACVLATAASLAFTLWLVRPRAPDGSDYDVTYEEGIAGLEQDVSSALDDVVPGRWRALNPISEGSPCTDWFGRDKGAVYGSASFEIDGLLSDRDFHRFDTAVSAPDRETQAPRFGRPLEWGGQDRERFVVTVEEDAGDDRTVVDIVTPCLRTERAG